MPKPKGIRVEGKDIYTVNFAEYLPPVLKHDPKMKSLAEAVAAEALKVSGGIENVLIYARIDELQEELLDILAFDMHIDWYDYSFPVEVKRDIVKNSVKVHKKMGTKYAVEKALESIYPDSYVQEWWEYGGKPFTFKVVLNMTQAKVIMNNTIFDVYKTVQIYKRLSAHLENIEVFYRSKDKCKSVCYAKIGNTICIKEKPAKDLMLLSNSKLVAVQKIGTTISLKTKEV